MGAVLRLGVLLVLFAIAGCVAMSMLTGEQRWRHYAWQILKYTLALAGVVLVFLAVDQIVTGI